MPKAPTQPQPLNFGNAGPAPIAAPGWQPPQQPSATPIDAAIAQQADNLAGQHLLAAAGTAPHFGESGSAPIVALVDDITGDFINTGDDTYSLLSDRYNQGLPQTRLSTLPKVEGAPPVAGLSTLMQPVYTGNAESTSEVVSIHGPFIDEEEEHVPDWVKRLWWNSNPNKRKDIPTSALTKNMQGFLRYNHDVSLNDGKSQWSYNDKGFHPIHTLMECICAHWRTFPKMHPWYRGWTQVQKTEFVVGLVQEAVRLTIEEYGDCTCRTHSDRPTNNTPLMLYSKAACKVVNRHTQIELLETLVNKGGGITSVDSNGNNAVMLAAGHDNHNVFRWFFEHAPYLRDTCGFDWKHKNNDGRNVLSLVRNRTDSGRVLYWCLDLANRGFMTNDVFDSDTQSRGGPGGISTANQRWRSSSGRT